MTSSLVIPAFNEQSGIDKTLQQLKNLDFFNNYEVIIIDDGSTDGTAEIVKKYPVILIQHTRNMGYGAALKTGIRRSTCENIIIFDSDGQHDPKNVKEIEQALLEYDIVIGERDKNSFQYSNRSFGKKLIKLVGEYLVDQNLPDFNSGFRGFNKEIIRSMLHLMPNGFSFSTTSTIAFIKEGYDIGKISIHVDERIGRKSNVSFLKDGTKAILLIARIIMLFNPLKIFFPCSILFGALGIFWAFWGAILGPRVPNSSIILIVFSMFLFFFGLIADQISMLNRRTKFN